MRLDARPSISIRKLIERVHRAVVMLVHRIFYDGIDIGERASVMEKGIDGNLVCGIEYAGKRSAFTPRNISKLKTPECIGVGLPKGKRC